MADDSIQHLLDDRGRLTTWPAKAKKQLLALQYFAGKIAWGREYTEKEIGDLLTQFHTFQDTALLRRELYMKHFIDRKADGSAYWKTARLLPSTWKTERLQVRDATEADAPALQSIYDACGYIKEWIGSRDDRENTMLLEVRGEILPPNGNRLLQRAQAITDRESAEILGYVIVYHGYPDAETFWVALFGIDPKAHRQGIGKEVVGELQKQVRALGTFKRMGLGVGIGNDPAMKFWSSCGFLDHGKIEDHGTHKDQWLLLSLEG